GKGGARLRPPPTARGAARPRQKSSALFRFRAGDLHGSRPARAVFLDVRRELLGRAADDVVALVDKLLLTVLRLLHDLARVLVDAHRRLARRAGGKKEPEPGMRLDLRIAELRERRHIRQARRALR